MGFIFHQSLPDKRAQKGSFPSLLQALLETLNLKPYYLSRFQFSSSAMGFFDLNIPYLDSAHAEKTAPRAIRTKLVVKAMEMGYTGIAYNRTMRGVMSDRDSCSIALLSLSSLLKLAPSLTSSVQLHRELLGVPRGSPFRQYTRLTVCVDSIAQGQALNSGNPVLKTYDLVAVRPLNQTAFDQACEKMEVDMIAIDFTDKLPFRLKLPMVKAAIGRGVYFEITYSGLIGDVQTRRQMITNAKLLVDWTRGKNLIFSSCAPSVNELRGPNDVSNLVSLFGLSMQCAKAAISKNCSMILANALRKRQFYKEAIRLEVIPPGQQTDSKNVGPADWLKWDPISSGEGDMLLDDLAKGFSASDKSLKTVKAINFTSVLSNMPFQGFQVRDLISGTRNMCQSLRDNSTAKVSVPREGEPEQSKQQTSHSEAVHTSLSDALSGPRTSISCPIKSSPVDCLKVISDTKEIAIQARNEDELKVLNESDVHTSSVETEMHDVEPQKHVSGFESNVVLLNDDMEVELDYGKDGSDAKEIKTQVLVNEEPKTDNDADVCSVEAEMNDIESEIRVLSSGSNVENAVLCISGMEIPSEGADVEISTRPKETSGLVCPNEESKSKENSIVSDALWYNGELQIDGQCQAHISLQENVLAREHLKGPGDDEDIITSKDPGQYVESCNGPEGIDDSQLQRHKIKEPQPVEHGNSRAKHRIPRGAYMFPFKRLLNPVSVPSKRKSQKSKGRSKRV